MPITIKYYVWLKTLHFINDILLVGKKYCILLRL